MVARQSIERETMVSYSQMVRSNRGNEFVTRRKLCCLSRNVMILKENHQGWVRIDELNVGKLQLRQQCNKDKKDEYRIQRGGCYKSYKKR